MLNFFQGKKHIFVCSNLGWDYPAHVFQTLLARVLAEHNQVWWINPGTRNPLKFIRDNTKRRKIHQNLTIYTPILSKTISVIQSPVDLYLWRRQLCNMIGALDDKDTVIWSIAESQYELMKSLKSSFKIYFTGDMFDPSSEMKSLNIYDLILTLTDQKYEQISNIFPERSFASSTFCDFEVFHGALGSAEPSCLKSLKALKQPIVGYIGGISTHRMDFDLLDYVIQHNPKLSFVLVGPIQHTEGTAEAVSSLTGKYSNVHIVKAKLYHEIPLYINQFDVCITPYKLNAFNLGCNPTKLYEYLSLGKPVVSVSIPSIMKFEPLVLMANTREQFDQKLKEALLQVKDVGLFTQRVKLAREYSTEQALQRIDDYIVRSCSSKVLAT